MRKARAVTAAAVITAGTLLFAAGCHTYDEPPFNPREIGRTPRLASKERIIREKEAIPTTMPTSPSTRASVRAATTQGADEGDIVVRLSLQEVIQRTVAHNSDVAVAGYEPAIDETRVIEAEARFDPTFFSNVTFSDEEVLSPSGSFVNIDPFDPSGFQSLAFQNGIRQNLYSGGQAEFSYRTQRIFRDEIPKDQFGNRDANGPNPYYLNELILKVTQPLLRDFGAEINRARITIARNNQRISTLEFRRTLEEQVASVEEAYWKLAQAVTNVKIQSDLLAETIRTADILNRRKDVGVDVTRVQTSQAEAAVASREATLVRARSDVKNFSDEIKRRMGDPAYPTSSAILILPAVDPLNEPLKFDPAEQFDTGLKNRLELGQQQIRIDSAAIAMNVAQNNLLPQLNLVGQVSFQGAGEDLGDAFDAQFEFREPSYSVGFEFEIPFGNRLARAVLKRAQYQRRQAIEQYVGLIKQIEQDVSTSLREVDTSWEEMVKRRRAVFLSADSLRAIQQRREADEPLVPTFVQLELDSQQTLANARAEEAQAIANYNVGISRLERSKGTLLRYNNIVMQEQQLQK